EAGLVGTCGSGYRRVQLDAKLAFAEADPLELFCDCGRERRRGLRSCFVERAGELLDAPLGGCDALCCCGKRICPGLDGRELVPGLGCAIEQLLVGRAAEAPLRFRDPVELPLDVLEPVGFGLEGGEKGSEIRCGLPKAELDVSELVAGAFELRREVLQ